MTSLLDLPAACAALGGISDSKIRKLIKAGVLQAVYQGRKIYVTAAAIDAYVSGLQPVGSAKEWSL